MRSLNKLARTLFKVKVKRGFNSGKNLMSKHYIYVGTSSFIYHFYRAAI